MVNINHYSEQIIGLLIEFAPKLLTAIVFLIIGLWLIKKVVSLSGIAFDKKKFDKSLIVFLKSIISIGLKILLLVTVAEILGIKTTSVIALLGAAGLAVGLALQGSLANFAGGVLILIFKPFKVGDMVEIMGQKGKVEEIQIFHTILKGEENKTIIIPNGPLLNGVVVNSTYYNK